MIVLLLVSVMLHGSVSGQCMPGYPCSEKVENRICMLGYPNCSPGGMGESTDYFYSLSVEEKIFEQVVILRRAPCIMVRMSCGESVIRKILFNFVNNIVKDIQNVNSGHTTQ